MPPAARRQPIPAEDALERAASLVWRSNKGATCCGAIDRLWPIAAERQAAACPQLAKADAAGAVAAPSWCRAASLNHLVGGRQQRFRDGEAERLGGLEVD